MRGISKLAWAGLAIAAIAPVLVLADGSDALNAGAKLLQNPYARSVSEASRFVNAFFENAARGAIDQGTSLIPSAVGGAIRWVGSLREAVGSVKFAEYVPKAKEAISAPGTGSPDWLKTLIQDIKQTFWVIADRARTAISAAVDALSRKAD